MLKIHLRGSKSVSGGLLGGVGEVDHDAEAVHLLNHRLQSKVIIRFTVTITYSSTTTITIISTPQPTSPAPPRHAPCQRLWVHCVAGLLLAGRRCCSPPWEEQAARSEQDDHGDHDDHGDDGGDYHYYKVAAFRQVQKWPQKFSLGAY